MWRPPASEARSAQPHEVAFFFFAILVTHERPDHTRREDKQVPIPPNSGLIYRQNRRFMLPFPATDSIKNDFLTDKTCLLERTPSIRLNTLFSHMRKDLHINMYFFFFKKKSPRSQE